MNRQSDDLEYDGKCMAKYKHLIGYVTVLIGCLGLCYSVFSIYAFYSITTLLFFLHRSYSGLVFFIVMAAASAAVMYVGVKLLRDGRKD
jgi:hypothetical protein